MQKEISTIKDTAKQWKGKAFRSGLMNFCIFLGLLLVIEAVLFFMLRSSITERYHAKYNQLIRDAEKHVHNKLSQIWTDLHYVSITDHKESLQESELFERYKKAITHYHGYKTIEEVSSAELCQRLKLNPSELQYKQVVHRNKLDSLSKSRENTLIFMQALSQRERFAVVELNGDVFDSIFTDEAWNNGEFTLLGDHGNSINCAISNEYSFSSLKSEGSFDDYYPALWESITNKKQGYEVSDSGVFYFRELNPQLEDSVSGNGKWYLVYFVANHHLKSETNILMLGLFWGFVILGPIVGFLGFRNGYFRVYQKMHLKRMTELATHDSLTGLYNRGAIMSLLKGLCNLSKRQKTHLAVAFIDVNDLKLFNDKLGHEAGDELIVGLSTAINSTIRFSDLAARLGGDEFLVVFPGCAEGDIEDVMVRIENSFATLGKNKFSQNWTLSWGSATLEGDEDSVEDIVARADEQMYLSKISFKASCAVS